jgi:hypothetical protein
MKVVNRDADTQQAPSLSDQCSMVHKADIDSYHLGCEEARAYKGLFHQLRAGVLSAGMALRRRTSLQAINCPHR